MGKILRGCRAMWLGKADKMTLLGKDADDLSIETNPKTEQKQNVQGETTFEHSGYTPSMKNEYIARKEDEIYPELQKIVDGLLTDDESITMDLIVATLDEEVKEADTKTLTGKGFKVRVKVSVDSDGGGSTGYSIPFTIYESGNRVQGTVSVAVGRKPTFTPNAGASTASLDTLGE